VNVVHLMLMSTFIRTKQHKKKKKKNSTKNLLKNINVMQNKLR